MGRLPGAGLPPSCSHSVFTLNPESSLKIALRGRQRERPHLTRPGEGTQRGVTCCPGPLGTKEHIGDWNPASQVHGALPHPAGSLPVPQNEVPRGQLLPLGEQRPG